MQHIYHVMGVMENEKENHSDTVSMGISSIYISNLRNIEF